MKIKRFFALLLAVCILLGLLTACGKSEEPTQTDAPTDKASDPTSTEAGTDPTQPTELPTGDGDDVTALSNYAVSEASPHDANMSAVVAVTADGTPALTNSTLQFIYWLEFFNFMNYYGSYAEYFGLDAYTPLAEQPSMTENRTWEQYFLESATEGFAQQYALYRAAQDAGYTITEEEQAQLDDILDPNGSIATGAAQNGYDSAEAYMQDNFGPGVDMEDYYEYVKIYITANSYYTYLMENTDEATAGAYYDAHIDALLEKNVQKSNNVGVRHILIQPEGEQDAEGNYSDEAWAAAEATANEILAQWKQNPTEDNFADLANEKSADGGSNTNGGLYESFKSSTMVREFSDWSFDPVRTYGDTGIVKTSYGYHIMFFVGQTEEKGWIEDVVNAMIDDIYTSYPVTFYFSRMRVFDLVSMMAAQDGVTATDDETPQETIILPEDTFEP